MGILRGGILGEISGKVSGIVAGKWKDKNYVRQYTKPANPNTASQQVQRSLFSACVDFAKPLVGPVFNAYTDMFQRSMSGFNYFIKRNITLFTDPIETGSIKITEGKLAIPTPSGATAVVGLVTVDFSTALGANGKVTDDVIVACYDVDDKLWAFSSAPVPRNTGTIDAQFAGDVTGHAVECYIFAAQKENGIVKLVSDSAVVTMA